MDVFACVTKSGDGILTFLYHAFKLFSLWVFFSAFVIISFSLISG